MWKENLFNNLIVLFVLLALAAIIYCRVKGVTMVELFKEIREILSPIEEVE